MVESSKSVLKKSVNLIKTKSYMKHKKFFVPVEGISVKVETFLKLHVFIDFPS